MRHVYCPASGNLFMASPDVSRVPWREGFTKAIRDHFWNLYEDDGQRFWYRSYGTYLPRSKRPSKVDVLFPREVELRYAKEETMKKKKRDVVIQKGKKLKAIPSAVDGESLMSDRDHELKRHPLKRIHVRTNERGLISAPDAMACIRMSTSAAPEFEDRSVPPTWEMVDHERREAELLQTRLIFLTEIVESFVTRGR